MNIIGNPFDFNGDGRIDSLERAVEITVLEDMLKSQSTNEDSFEPFESNDLND